MLMSMSLSLPLWVKTAVKISSFIFVFGSLQLPIPGTSFRADEGSMCGSLGRISLQRLVPDEWPDRVLWEMDAAVRSHCRIGPALETKMLLAREFEQVRLESLRDLAVRRGVQVSPQGLGPSGLWHACEKAACLGLHPARRHGVAGPFGQHRQLQIACGLGRWRISSCWRGWGKRLKIFEYICLEIRKFWKFLLVSSSSRSD